MNIKEAEHKMLFFYFLSFLYFILGSASKFAEISLLMFL